MTRDTRRPVTASAVAALAAAGAFAVGAGFASPALARADPNNPNVPLIGGVAPVDPDAAPLPPNVPPAPTIMAPLTQNGAPVGLGGLPLATPDLSGNTANEFVLAQNPAPKLPGGPPDAATAPNLNPLNNQYMLPRNLKPSAPGQGQLYDVDPGDEKADLTKGDYAKHLWHGYQEGLWKGTLVGRRPKAELNEPLPGTAPPQGTRIPGLGDDSQAPPPEQWHWTPPDPPGSADGVPPPASGAPAPEPAPPPAP